MANLNKWLLIGFGAVWTLLILVSYLGFHPYYSVALGSFPNADLLFTLVVACGGAWWWLRRRDKPVAGWMIYAMVLILEILLFGLYANREKIFPDSAFAHVPYFLGYMFYLHAAVLFLLLVHLALGEGILRFVPHRLQSANRPYVAIALGLSLSGFILVWLGWGGGLNPWVLWGLSLLVIGLQYRTVWSFLRGLFLQPVKKAKHDWWFLAAIFAAMIVLAIMDLTAVKSFPTGFDAAALYINRSHLIAGYHNLVPGGQAEYWPVLTGAAEIMFGSVSVSMLISHLMIVLCGFVLFRLGREFMSRERAWLPALALWVSPAFAFHGAHDAKVDLAFLFVVLSSLLLILDTWRSTSSENNEPVPGPSKGNEGIWAWALSGWLAGYAFGIKYTAIMVVIGLLTLLFRHGMGWRGSLGVFFCGLGVLFQGGMSEFGYLEMGDVTRTQMALVCVGIGLPFLVWAFVRFRDRIWHLLTRTALFILSFAIAFTPWIAKNLSEHNAFSVKNVLIGQSKTISLDTDRQAWTDSAKAETQRQIVRDAFQRIGVYFSTDQEARVATILQNLLTGSETGSQAQDRINEAKRTVLQEVLTPDQRKMAETRLFGISMQLDSLNSSVAIGLQLITQNLNQRGIYMDDDQKAEVVRLLSEDDRLNADRDIRRQRMAEVREEVFRSILSESQVALATGLKEGRLQIDGQKNVVNASLFGNDRREEIKRYLGFETGWPLFLSIPYDLTMNVNVPFSRYLDITFIFLLLLPFLWFGRSLAINAVTAVGMILLWLVSVMSLYPVRELGDDAALNQHIQDQLGLQEGWLGGLISPLFTSLQMSLARVLPVSLFEAISGWGFLPVFLGMVGLAGLGLAGFRTRGRNLPETLGSMLTFALAFGALWIIFGNAIVWYGFPLFAILILLLVWLVDHLNQWLPDASAKLVLQWWRWGFGLSLGLSFSLFFVSAVADQNNAEKIFQSSFLAYAATPMTVGESLNHYRPFMKEAVEKLNEDGSAPVYRIGTHLNYHILRNDRRVLEDNQLNYYSQLTSRMTNKEDFLRLLIQKGYKYVLYDLQIAEIDRTPEKSLTRKSDDFFRMILTSKLAVPLFTDNFISDPNVPQTKVAGTSWPGRPGIGDNITVPGTFILFELKAD